MKKWCSVFCVAGLLFFGMGLASAQPEPVRQVEMIRKPGINFHQFKSVGTEVSVSLAPTSDWAIDKSDPFLQLRIQDLTLKAAKKQGWVPIDNVDADLKLAVKILEWGRLRNSKDPNLLEFVTVEFKAYSTTAEGLVFRGMGKYSRVDPDEPDLTRVNKAFVSIMEEFLAELHSN